MRQYRTVQASIFDLFAKHEIGCELKKASAWLDEHPALIGLVAGDVRRDGVQETGRQGLPAEAVLRCALLKQYRQLSYEELAFHLEDSASFRAFARLPWAWSPKKSVLHKTISAIRAETWEAINRTLLASARHEKLEDGSIVRLDSTVTAALMHEPSDSSLLWDAVRGMVRLLKQAQAWMGGIGRDWRDHRRAAKRRWRAIEFTRGRPKRVPLYRELIEITRKTLAYLRGAAARLAGTSSPAVVLWRAKVRHYETRIETLSVKNGIVTLDAMGCQKTIASRILDRHADYLLVLKANQGTAFRAIRACCEQHCFARGATGRPVFDGFDDSHGRLVRRRVFVCPEAASLEALRAWPGLRTVLAVETIRGVNGSGTVEAEIRYFLSSCGDNPKVLIQAIRRHWTIENGLHWVLDVTFREDDSRVRDRTAARNLAILRKVAINLISHHRTAQISMRARRKQAAWNDQYMLSLLAG